MRFSFDRSFTIFFAIRELCTKEAHIHAHCFDLTALVNKEDMSTRAMAVRGTASAANIVQLPEDVLDRILAKLTSDEL